MGMRLLRRARSWKSLLAGTAAEPFLADGAVKLFDNLRSSSGDALKALEYVAHAGKGPFSISK